MGTTKAGTVVDALFQPRLETLQPQTHISHFSYYKSNISHLPAIVQQ